MYKRDRGHAKPFTYYSDATKLACEIADDGPHVDACIRRYTQEMSAYSGYNQKSYLLILCENGLCPSYACEWLCMPG